MKSVTFILPGPGDLPVGGFKVVYEYAHHLTRRGHRVTVVEPAVLGRSRHPPSRLRAYGQFISTMLANRFRPDAWFRLDPGIRLRAVPSLKEGFIPDADAIFATAWRTAEWVAGYPLSKGCKCYLIQHLETWDGPENEVLDTWRLPLNKVVISCWLRKIANEMGEEAEHIPNGLDPAAFGIDRDVSLRNPTKLAMLLHESDWKGSADGLKAITLAREQIGELSADLFGTCRAKNLPSWAQFHRCPPQKELRRIYNSAAIFVAPSWAEGWPLPPAEAMLCGAAVAATDIGGHREYMEHEVSALLSPPKSPELLARNIERLILDSESRPRIAKNGTDCIRDFTWERAAAHMEAFLQRLWASKCREGPG
mgnify:CR=1 FL=1